MKLTNAQLQMTEEALSTLTISFRNGELARSFTEHKRTGKKLLWAGPRIVRNCKMLVDEIKYLRRNQRLMVDGLERIRQHGEVGAPGSTIKMIAEHYLKQVGELDD